MSDCSPPPASTACHIISNLHGALSGEPGGVLFSFVFLVTRLEPGPRLSDGSVSDRAETGERRASAASFGLPGAGRGGADGAMTHPGRAVTELMR